VQKDDLGFLSRSFERHFNDRPYLKHTCYLFLTKTTKEHSRTMSNFNALTRGFIIPKEMQDEEITGTPDSSGIIEKYFSLSQEDVTCLHDITLGAGEMKVGDNCPFPCKFFLMI